MYVYIHIYATLMVSPCKVCKHFWWSDIISKKLTFFIRLGRDERQNEFNRNIGAINTSNTKNMISNNTNDFTLSNESQLAFSQMMKLTYHDENERRKILPKHPWHVAPEKEERPVSSIYDYSQLPVEHQLLAISQIDLSVDDWRVI